MSEINTITLYSTALCNLRCSYCYIQKNSRLAVVDKELEESFKGDYYINLLKNRCDDLSKINKLEIWGGEPTLHLDRTHNTVRQLIDATNISTIFISSNLCAPNALQSLRNFFSVLGEYKERKFSFRLQISIDGPAEINDVSRGSGTTQAIINNFNILIANSFFIPDNVLLDIRFKPTCSTDNFEKFLSKEFAFSYYKFFEDTFIKPVRELDDPKIKVKSLPVPNLAIPAEYTQEHGFILADIIKNLWWVQENNTFDYYENIVWFNKNPKPDIKKDVPYCFVRSICGSTQRNLCLLPKNITGVCHRLFTDYIEQNTALYDQFLFADKDKQELQTYKANNLCNNKSTSMMIAVTEQIKLLAELGQINTKYIDEQTAKVAAIEIFFAQGACPVANISTTGTTSVLYNSLLKLFLNGALDAILRRD